MEFNRRLIMKSTVSTAKFLKSHIPSDDIKVNPSESLCKGSSGLLLEYTLKIHNTSDWINTRTHYFQGQTIRYLAG